MITYPLNNILYSAEDAELFHCTRTSGVFSADDEFAASVTGADNTVTIGPGIAWIRNAKFSGKVAANKTSVSLDMGLADGSYPRIDAVVVQFDANANQTSIVVKNGVAASSPVPPEVVQTEAIYELHLYHVRRGAGAAVVSASDITDLRQDRNYCGVMMDDVTNIDENKFLSKTAYDPTGTVEAAGGIPAYVAENAPKTTVVDSVTSTSNTSAASAASVKKAYDQAVAAKNAIPTLSDSVSSTSKTTAANSYAVKQAYDKAAAAIPNAQKNVANGVLGLDERGMAGEIASYDSTYLNSNVGSVTGSVDVRRSPVGIGIGMTINVYFDGRNTTAVVVSLAGVPFFANYGDRQLQLYGGLYKTTDASYFPNLFNVRFRMHSSGIELTISKVDGASFTEGSGYRLTLDFSEFVPRLYL